MLKFIMKFGYSKKEASWVLYDVANSAYVLTVITIFFPIYYAVVAKDVPNHNQIFMFLTSGIALFVALLSPVIGSIVNYKGNKKKFFKFFILLGIIGGFGIAVPGLNWIALLVVFVISSVGYNTTNVIYDAFLVDVTNEERMDEVSAFGFAMGYIGSLIPFFIGMIPYAFITFGIAPNVFKPEYETLAISFAFIVACVWWLIVSLPILRNVEQTYEIEHEEKPVIKSIQRLIGTFKDIKKYKNIFLFLIAYLLYIDVVNTVIRLAMTVGDELEVGVSIMLGVVIAVQVIAFPCAIIYGKLAKKYGGKIMIIFGISMYALLILIVSQIVPGREYLMWIVAIVVGSAQGGIQSVSRSYFAKMLPLEKANEFFGFFSVFGRFAGIFSPFLLGLLTLSVETNKAVLVMFGPLLLGFALLLFVKNKKAVVE